MITADYLRTMVRYNNQMNATVYAAADRLGEAARRADRGAYWGSIHGTLSHIAWADTMWLCRFEDTPLPDAPMRDSPRFIEDYGVLRQTRAQLDERLGQWAGQAGEAWLAADQTWFSTGRQADITLPRTLLVAHMFNHQTHHRGQAHAMLTAAGERTDDTDLWMLG